MKNSRKVTRRHFLSTSTAFSAGASFFSPINLLMNGLVNGIVSKAQAEANPAALLPRNYVYVCLAAAPSRFTFDYPMNPYAGTAVMPHSAVVTRFGNQNGAATAAQYATTPVTKNGVTLQMPHLWSCQIPTAGGGWTNMSELLANMMILRGYTMLGDGHGPDREKQLRPTRSSPSLAGLVADKANTPIPAVASTTAALDSAAYASSSGVGQAATSDVTGGTGLNQLLGDFDKSKDALDATYLTRRSAMNSLVEQALKSLGKTASSRAPGADALFTMRNKAETILTQGVGNLSSAFGTLYAKYQDLILRSADTTTHPIVGVTDLKVPFNVCSNLGGLEVTQINPNVSTQSADLRRMLLTAQLNEIAGSYAIAEYMLTHGYSSSITVGSYFLGSITMENLINIQNKLGLPNVVSDMNFDQHTVGTPLALILNSYLFRSVAACTYELIHAMGKTLFDETVIQIGAEFARIPKADNSGTDHNWMGNTTSLFSGAIKQPLVLGNIYVDKAPAGISDQGKTWGYGAPTTIDGGMKVPTVGNMTSTVAALLRVNPPSSNNGPMAVESANGGISPVIELATNK